MTTIVEATDVSKAYKTTTALDRVSVKLEENRIYGLLGRNGAGKSTLMASLTAQAFPDSGDIRVFGSSPYERDSVLRRMRFVRESQVYPDDCTGTHALRMARLFSDNWDEEFAQRLVADFRLPLGTVAKKFSRGQHSALGIVIGLASRAELTFFDEPYLGLDAVARQIFYDRLLEDFAEHPRTIVLSSHLIDEISHLVEHVIVIDEGRIILDAETERIRGMAVNVVGPRNAVDAFVGDREVLHRESLGRTASVTFLGTLEDGDRARLSEAQLDLAPVSLQQLVVRLTQAQGSASEAESTKEVTS